MKKLLLLILNFSVTIIFAQNAEIKGVPSIENFTPNHYKNAGKIWQINAANNGVLFGASDQGLLKFDGKKWDLYKGSKGVTRSVFVANDSLIYTGSDIDFGVWKRDHLNNFNYKSLYPKRSKNNKVFEEFWGVFRHLNQIVFVSHENIYLVKNNKTIAISAPTKWHESFISDRKIYIADEKKGLFTLDNNQLKLVFKYPENTNLEIIGLYKKDNKRIIVTRYHGLFSLENNTLSPINNSLSTQLKTQKVFSFKQLDDRFLAFGTILDGLYISDSQGNLVHQIDKKKGLLNNTILSLYNDNFGNLWCGMDYGLSKIYLKNKFTYFFDYSGNFGSGNNALLNENRFYLGTNQGLYISNWNDLNDSTPLNQFKIIPGSEGQVWSLNNIHGEILMGHDQGLFKISNEKIQKLDDEHGVWTMKIFREKYLLTGNYNGISVYSKINNEWHFLKKIDGIGGSCNQIEIENQNILWVNIPNYGVVRTEIDDHLETSHTNTYLENQFVGGNFNLILVNGKVKLQTNLFNYIFDQKSKKFAAKPLELVTDFNTDLVIPYKNPTIINSDYLFHPLDNGFAFEQLNLKKETPVFNPTVFSGLEIFNNSETKNSNPMDKIPYKLNNIRLTFIVPQTKNVLYQYRFGNEKNWSSWTANNRFEFLNLNEGKYDFYVRSKVNEHYNAVKKISFSISPPFYRTTVAYLFYLMTVVFAFLLYREREKKILIKQRNLLLKRHQKKLQKQAEKFRKEKVLAEQVQLEKEKLQLQQQVKDKTIELAIKAKEDEDKNRLLVNVKEKLEEVQKNPVQNSMRIKEVNRLLDSYLSIDDHTFEIQMDELHQSFFKNLQEEHPELSIYDLRLCAYLKTGLNTHEISEILNVLPSSLYVKRSRLRKKLDLGADEDLYVFLNKF